MSPTSAFTDLYKFQNSQTVFHEAVPSILEKNQLGGFKSVRCHTGALEHPSHIPQIPVCPLPKQLFVVWCCHDELSVTLSNLEDLRQLNCWIDNVLEIVTIRAVVSSRTRPTRGAQW